MTLDCVCQYNQYMGGVDLFDMRIYFFQDKRMTKQWNVKVFFLLFRLTLSNTFVYQSNTAVPLLYQKSLESCVYGLSDFRTSRHKVPLLPIPHQKPHPIKPDCLIYHVDHQIVKFLPTVSTRCKVCLAKDDKDRKVHFCCKRSNVRLCVVDSFWSYHTFLDFSVAV